MSENLVCGCFQNRFHAGYQNAAVIAFHQMEVKAVLFRYKFVKLYKQRVCAVHKAGTVKP